VVDEIATSAYVSQAQRQKEAETILSDQPERDEIIESLERALALKYSEPSEPEAEPLNQPQDNASPEDEERFTSLKLTKNQAIEVIQKLRSELNQTQTIEKLWECKKGGSEAWKRAYAQFKNLTEEK
jgi:galactokinase/mevalonate kinase-like predicted kinase